MARPIKIKINVSRILKEHLYSGKNGKYLDLVAWPNKNGTGQYGDTHFVVQDIPREARDQGVKGPILGNLTLPEEEFMPKHEGDGRPEPKRKLPPRSRQEPEGGEIIGMDDSSEIPF